LQEEQLQLRNENLELYRRLRLLRVSHFSSNANNNNNNYNKLPEEIKTSGLSNNSSKKKMNFVNKNNAIESAKHWISGNLTSTNLENNNDEKITNERNNTENDAIELKYLNLYEKDLSPFKLETIDKINIFQKLNIFEKFLVFINKNFMEDRWGRHFLLLYIFCVHLLALGYVFRLMNPQLIDEVDLLNAKWSEDAMNKAEKHLDN
jgi:hypothetical protein